MPIAENPRITKYTYLLPWSNEAVNVLISVIAIPNKAISLYVCSGKTNNTDPETIIVKSIWKNAKTVIEKLSILLFLLNKK